MCSTSVWICFFLAFTPFLSSPCLSNSVVRSGWCFLLQHEGRIGFWAYVLCLSSLLWTGHYLGKSLHLPTKPMFLFLVFVGLSTIASTISFHHAYYSFILLLLCVKPWACDLLYQSTSSSIFCSRLPRPTSHTLTSLRLCRLAFLLYQPISSFYPSGFLGPFTTSLPLLFPWLFAKSFGLPQPNYHIFTSHYFLGLLAFRPTHWVY